MSDNWREATLDAIIQQSMDHQPARSNCIRTNEIQYVAIKAAAEKRGMSTLSYMRRAVLAFAVLDGVADWDELMQQEPGIAAHGVAHPGKGGKYARGKGFGKWKIVKVESYGE